MLCKYGTCYEGTLNSTDGVLWLMMYFGVRLNVREGQTLTEKLEEMAGERLPEVDPLEADILAYINLVQRPRT